MSFGLLVPSLLVFGILQKIPTANFDLAIQEKHKEAAQTAKGEMETNTSEICIPRALIAILLTATQTLLEI